LLAQGDPSAEMAALVAERGKFLPGDRA
jgi:hypothetical protein